eukprot:5332817-Pleurochrysis_carterae.AAC.3
MRRGKSGHVMPDSTSKASGRAARGGAVFGVHMQLRRIHTQRQQVLAFGFRRNWCCLKLVFNALFEFSNKAMPMSVRKP